MDKVIHFEVPADDVERAKKFYQSVFGWRIVPMPEMNYNILHTGPTDEKTGMMKETGFINGGMPKRQKPVMSPMITISVSSIDEAGKRISANGGNLVQ